MPTLAFGLLLGGCYLHHGSADPSPDAVVPPPPDGGVPRFDGGGRRDAGPRPDASLRCAPARADFACFESFLIEPNRAFVLPLSFDVCGCCAEAECAVDVDRSSRTLRVTTTLCPDPCDCDGCNTPVARCEVPPLPEGDWVVEVDGTIAMSLPVFADSGLVPPPPACVDFAEPDPCTREGVLTGRPQPVARACAAPSLDGVQHVVEVTDTCGTCDREGPCIVRAERRFTDDLPPGTEIYVEPRRFFGACDGACPPVCIETTRTCVVPPLTHGEVHRVHVGGLPTFFLAPGSTVCVGD